MICELKLNLSLNKLVAMGKISKEWKYGASITESVAIIRKDKQLMLAAVGEANSYLGILLIDKDEWEGTFPQWEVCVIPGIVIKEMEDYMMSQDEIMSIPCMIKVMWHENSPLAVNFTAHYEMEDGGPEGPRFVNSHNFKPMESRDGKSFPDVFLGIPNFVGFDREFESVFDPEVIAPFAKASRILSGAPPQVISYALAEPALVNIGVDGFFGVVMPLRPDPHGKSPDFEEPMLDIIRGLSKRVPIVNNNRVNNKIAKSQNGSEKIEFAF